jgi:uncharacterized cupredoxin-like copper-binding protein
MEPDFRSRVARPILMLVGLVVGIGLIAFSVSRVLLAVPETVATFTALALASYLLGLAVLIGKRRTITPRALGAGMAVGIIALVAAGVLSAQVGMRDLHAEEHAEGEEGEAAAAEPTTEIPEDALVWVSVDIDYAEEVNEAAAGEQTIAIDNTEGNLPHNVTIEGTSIRVHAEGGQTAAHTVELEPGTYTFFCDVPGHRATMEGTLEVS